MPKSCLLVFSHSKRKRQNDSSQIKNCYFHFFPSLPLRFTASSLSTFFPKQVYLYGVLPPLKSLQSWEAWNFEWFCFYLRVCVLVCPRLRSGCSGYTLVSHLYPVCLPLVSHFSPTSPTQHVAWCAWCDWWQSRDIVQAWPGNLSLEKTRSKTRSKRDENEIWALAGANSQKVNAYSSSPAAGL